jgi:membrane-associated protein
MIAPLRLSSQLAVNVLFARSLPAAFGVLGVAGVSRTFTVWQVAGGLLRRTGLTRAGYGLGSSVPDADRYLLPVSALIVVVCLVPLAAELVRSRRAAEAEEARG